MVFAPSGVVSEAVHQVAQEGEMGGGIKRREQGGGDLILAAQQLHSQCDALMPLPREHADKSGIERRVKYVLFVHIVITVAREDLQVERRKILIQRKRNPVI